MSQKDGSQKHRNSPREERIKAALRENLKRRKQKAKALKETPPTPQKDID